MVAKDFVCDIQRPRGAAIRNRPSDAKTKLVDAKLEMVRAGWLLQHVVIVRRLCWLDRVDRIQRDEIDWRLQRRPGASQGELCRN